ncbi:transcriptional regulator with XRE-family HTH domain [Nitrobacteraceae bacterium AZCC 2161]
MAQSGFGKRFPQRKATASKLLASNVRRLRMAKGWTQDELAAALKTEQGAISLIENARSNPTVLVLDALATALDAQMVELFEIKARLPRKTAPPASPRKPRPKP